MSEMLAPQVRIAMRVDRLEKRVAKAREAAEAGLLVKALEHEQCVEVHVHEIARLAEKYEIPINLHAILHYALKD